MRKSMKEALGSVVQGMVDNGIKTSFTEVELKQLGVKVPLINIDAERIKEIRKDINLSQSVFAKLLNVSSSAVKQWEQGKRTPTGSTKVLLELLKRNPNILDYRINLERADA